jgi:hypothetical protein
MKRSVRVVCPDCKHEQDLVVSTETEPFQVIVCSGDERGPGDILQTTGCGKNIVVRAKWSVSIQVGSLRWTVDYQ